MDALAQGYGSDSDSDSSSSPPQSTSTSTRTTNALNLLGSNYSDDSSDDDNDNHNHNHNESTKNGKNGTKSTTGTMKQDQKGKKDDGDDDDKQAKKKQKRQQQLPLPRLRIPPDADATTSTTKDNPFDALILFEKDYISELQKESESHRQIKSAPTSASLELLSSKLDTMYHTFNRNSNGNSNNQDKNQLSFARHLKNQKEFGNPYLFPSIIEHFHIDPLGSNCLDMYKYGDDVNGTSIGNEQKTKKKNAFAKFEYVENIVQKEEENRIRDHRC